MKQKLFLVSGSTRRADILKQIGIVPVIVDNLHQEEKQVNRSVGEILTRNALEKLRSVNPEADGFWVAADTALHFEGKIFEKPSSYAEAKQNLAILSGKTVEAVTGMAILQKPAEEVSISVSVTEIVFRELDDREIVAYLSDDSYQQFAAGFSLQGKGALLVRSITGSYSNVVGFPLETFQIEMKKFGVELL